MTRITGTSHEDRYTFLIISRSVLLRMRNISKLQRKSKHTHFMFSNFFSENRAFYETMRKNMVEPGRLMRTACWIPKATNTH